METRAIVIEEYGHADQLKESNVALPELGEHQVLVKIKATSVNPIDWKLREGYLAQMMPWDFPIILGWDVAGEIVEIGSAVKDWQVGQEIFARPETTRFGTYADYTIVDDHLLARKPEGASFEDAAAVPLAGLTAYQALFTHGKLKAGEKVLIHAGAGGVGIYAVQLAKNIGATVITTASKKNHALLKELGADQVIDYHTTDFSEVLEDIDLVFDTMGGDVQRDSFKVLNENGRLISIVSQPDEELAKNVAVAESIWLQPDGKQLQKIADLMTEGKVKSVVGHTIL
jgi:NADPH:quinone reductase-like Zn-dependent oxidoreductase